MQIDLSLEELRSYKPAVFEPDDFEDFWATAIADAAKLPLDVEVRPAESVVSAIDVFDVHFTGHGGARIAAWLYVPPNVEADTPVVVEFVGYGGGRGRPAEWLNWSCAGFPHLVMDSRGRAADGAAPTRPMSVRPENPGPKDS